MRRWVFLPTDTFWNRVEDTERFRLVIDRQKFIRVYQEQDLRQFPRRDVRYLERLFEIITFYRVQARYGAPEYSPNQLWIAVTALVKKRIDPWRRWKNEAVIRIQIERSRQPECADDARINPVSALPAFAFGSQGCRKTTAGSMLLSPYFNSADSVLSSFQATVFALSTR